MTFSVIQVLIALFAITRVVKKARTRDIPTVWAIVWTGVWIIAVGVSLLPQTTDLLAARVGIGRGADLLVYISVIALFYLVFGLVVKIESMQQEMTKLVRSIALKDLDRSSHVQDTEDVQDA